MIVQRYSDFRGAFGRGAFPSWPDPEGAPIDAAGYETWPVANLRINGFSTLPAAFPTVLSPIQDPGPPVVFAPYFPFVLTVDNEAEDFGEDKFYWYVSMRSEPKDSTDPTRVGQPLTIWPNGRIEPYGPSKSGTILVDLSEDVGVRMATRLQPNLAQLERVFRNVTIYVQRHSDRAIDLVSPSRELFADLDIS